MSFAILFSCHVRLAYVFAFCPSMFVLAPCITVQPRTNLRPRPGLSPPLPPSLLPPRPNPQSRNSNSAGRVPVGRWFPFSRGSATMQKDWTPWVMMQGKQDQQLLCGPAGVGRRADRPVWAVVGRGRPNELLRGRGKATVVQNKAFLIDWVQTCTSLKYCSVQLYANGSLKPSLLIALFIFKQLDKYHS